MRTAFAFILTILFTATVFTSCDQFKNLSGDKAAEEQMKLAEQKKLEEEKKKQLEEMAAQVAAKLAEDARKAEEEKKKMDAQIDAEVQKRLAEKEAEAKKAAETQAAAQPKKEEPVKVVERVIVKEKEPAKPNQQQPAANTQQQPAAKPSGYVRLYDDAGFTDRILTVRFGRDIGNMHYVSSDDGKSGFNDKASSVKYSVPDGYQAVLYENNNYAKRGYVLKGTGSIADLGFFGDKCSSLRWEKAQ